MGYIDDASEAGDRHLPSDYVWIKAWGNMMGSQPYYIEGQQRRASEDGAPVTAIYGRDGDWQTLATITNQRARDYLLGWAVQTGNEFPDEIREVWNRVNPIGQGFEQNSN